MYVYITLYLKKFKEYKIDFIFLQLIVSEINFCLCLLQSIAAHRDHFVQHLFVCPCVCLSGSQTFKVITHSFVLQATHAFLGMLPLFLCRLQSIAAHRDNFVRHLSVCLCFCQSLSVSVRQSHFLGSHA